MRTSASTRVTTAVGVRVLAASVVLAGLLTACSSGGGAGGDGRTPSSPTGSPSGSPAGSPSGGADVPAAAGAVGEPGSACPLPVTLSTAASWKPKAVPPGFTQGGLTLSCEIDAKPAGHIGFLRVWTADRAPGSARQVLENFLATVKTPSGSAPVFTETTAGPLAAVEAAFKAEVLDEAKEERAFAVVTPSGAAVVVHLGGLDTAEHRAMLPAYQLARESMKPRS
ncbi:lipoprotein [Streptomyces bambusae]|uniref:Lipoprotein n=1 Tax=Streptomyces bambusae TaxID=1550616 RepID=A0ABS6ZF94_9ACTN|nr:lipoprotein [Streptomyces bambusae]MBW5486271.1 hypothetical protein [Streptomyces bambusae]